MFAKIVYPYLNFAFPSIYMGPCINTFKDEVQTALFRGPVHTAQ